MTNTLSILMYLPLLIINSFFLCSVAKRKEKLYVDKLYILLCAALMGWLVFECLFYVFSDPVMIEFVYSAKFIFAAFIPPLFFFLVAGFYHLNETMPRFAKIALLVLPAAVAVIAATGIYHELFRKDFAILAMEPLTEVSSDWGPWYIVNLISCQVPVFLIVVIFVTQYKKLPKAYRVSVDLLLLSFIIYAVGFIVEVFDFDDGNTIDFNLMAVCVSNFIFYIAVSSNGRADYLNIWRRNIFDYLDEAVLLINGTGIVVEANQSAVQMLEGVVPAVEGVSMDSFFDEAEEDGNVMLREKTYRAANSTGQDLYIVKGQYPIVYSMHRLEIPGDAKMEGGEFVTFTNVTQNRLLLERMQSTAGVDQLTGVKNRFGYEQMLRELDAKENLPLSIIFGDVNGLKAINDKYGHEAGDILLVRIAELLKGYFKNGNIGRVGGDEFVILLERCSAEEVLGIMEELREKVDKITDFPYSVSVAFGSATKTHENENINQLLHRADQRMYKSKETAGVDADE